MGQESRAGSWAAFGNRIWGVAATGGAEGAVCGQPGQAGTALGRGFSGSAGEVGDEIWSPKPCWGQGKGGLEEALGSGNELWWPWNVTGPCGSSWCPLCARAGQRCLGLPRARWGRREQGLCCTLGSAGLRWASAGCPGHREEHLLPARAGWALPPGLPCLECHTTPWLCSGSLWFCSVRCKDLRDEDEEWGG